MHNRIGKLLCWPREQFDPQYGFYNDSMNISSTNFRTIIIGIQIDFINAMIKYNVITL